MNPLIPETVGSAEPVVPCTSGIAVRDMFLALHSIVGKDLVERAIASAPASVRLEFENATALSWVANTTVGRLLDDVAALAGLEPEAMIDDAIRLAVKHTFKTVWRMLLRLTSDDALIARAPIIYARSRNVGRLTARVLASGNAEILLTGWSDVSARQVRTIGVGIEAIVEFAGRKGAHMSARRTPDGVRYLLTWRC